MKKLIFLFFICTVSALPQSAGNSGMAFLKFGYGARNIAMGDAGTSVANDVTALFYNPAKLADNYESELIFMHNEWIQDVRSEMFGAKSVLFGLPVAIGFNVTSISDIEARTTSTPEPLSTFDANYFFGSISTGFNLLEDISLGVTAKYLYEGLFTDEATGYGFDFGLNHKTQLEGLSLSIVIKNIGMMNSLRKEETKLPAEFRVGPSYIVNSEDSDFGLTVATELHKYFDTDNIHLNFGMEVIYNKFIALRGGYQSGYESRHYTAGLGLLWGSLKLDYAFLPFSFGLGSANLFSLQLKF
jgi:hypothetical protein